MYVQNINYVISYTWSNTVRRAKPTVQHKLPPQDRPNVNQPKRCTCQSQPGRASAPQSGPGVVRRSAYGLWRASKQLRTPARRHASHSTASMLQHCMGLVPSPAVGDSDPVQHIAVRTDLIRPTEQLNKWHLNSENPREMRRAHQSQTGSDRLCVRVCVCVFFCVCVCVYVLYDCSLICVHEHTRTQSARMMCNCSRCIIRAWLTWQFRAEGGREHAICWAIVSVCACVCTWSLVRQEASEGDRRACPCPRARTSFPQLLRPAARSNEICNPLIWAFTSRESRVCVWVCASVCMCGYVYLIATQVACRCVPLMRESARVRRCLLCRIWIIFQCAPEEDWHIYYAPEAAGQSEPGLLRQTIRGVCIYICRFFFISILHYVCSNVCTNDKELWYFILIFDKVYPKPNSFIMSRYKDLQNDIFI